jgi:hypothetical protein
VNIFSRLKADYFVVLIEYARDYANGNWEVDNPKAYNHLNEIANIMLMYNFQDIDTKAAKRIGELKPNTIWTRFRNDELTIDDIVNEFSKCYQLAFKRMDGEIHASLIKNFLKIIEMIEEKEQIESEKSKLLEFLTS